MYSYNPGKVRFLYFLNQVQDILLKTEKTGNPASAAYSEDLRTPLFMPEALSRLYKKIHNHHSFSELNKLFKQLKDELGAIDYYDGFHKEFARAKKNPQALIDLIERQKNKKVKDFRQT